MREHTAAINPPRALWVSFILGRPFGVPGDAAFQRRVLLAVLKLLEALSGPVLEDFNEDAPQPAQEETEGFACPVNFGRAAAANDGELMQQEITELASWHRVAEQKRGRSTAALSGLTPEASARYLIDFIDNCELPSYRDDLARGLALRLVCEDLKAYYLESVNVQPGQRAAKDAHEWFWRKTAAGRVFVKLREVGLASDDKSVKGFASNNLVPRAILHTLTTKIP